MTPKIKKIIAKEGLLFVVYLISIGAFSIIASIIENAPAPPSGYVHENILLRYNGLFYILFGIILYAYPIYLIIRLIAWTLKAFKEKKITKNSLNRILKVVFAKDTLIRIILVLGILYLSISILKSCGIIKTRHSTGNRILDKYSIS